MDAKIAHLNMIQGVVNRLAGNSFLIKGWSVTLVAALFALAAADANRVFVYLAYFPSFMFWALDGYFLRQEQLFRKLYDGVRILPDASIDFSMNTTPFECEVDSAFVVACSKTLLIFHGAIVLTIAFVMITIARHG